MSYFNSKLFKEFTSMKTKIKPAMADDWEILTSSYNTDDGFILYSKKLKQEVADIGLRSFLDFCKKENLTIKGLKLQGNFIVGSDRSVYTQTEYDVWKKEFDDKTEVITNKNDAIIGHQYKTPDGKKVVFIGSRYVASIKGKPMREGKYGEFTKVSKKYFIATENTGNSEKEWNVDKLDCKLTVDMGLKLKEDVADSLLFKYYVDNQAIICWEKEKPAKDVEFGIIEHDDLEKRYYTGGWRDEANTLLFRHGGTIYASGTTGPCEMKYYGPEIIQPDPFEQQYDSYSCYEKKQQEAAYQRSKTCTPGFRTTNYNILNKDDLTFVVEGWYNKKEKDEVFADALCRIGIV